MKNLSHQIQPTSSHLLIKNKFLSTIQLKCISTRKNNYQKMKMILLMTRNGKNITEPQLIVYLKKLHLSNYSHFIWKKISNYQFRSQTRVLQLFIEHVTVVLIPRDRILVNHIPIHLSLTHHLNQTVQLQLKRCLRCNNHL